jgi:hypothetical protein
MSTAAPGMASPVFIVYAFIAWHVERRVAVEILLTTSATSLRTRP